MDTSNIMLTINFIAEKIFKEVETNVYELLDKLLIIGPNILKEEPLKNLFFENKTTGIVILSSSFLIFFAIYFAFSKINSMYLGTESENTFKFIIRTIISVILMSSSFYICYEILNINYLFTEIIKSSCSDLIKKDISFISLRETIIDLEKYMTEDFISLDGMIKSMISFGAISLVLNFSIRYATIIFLIILSPLAFMMSTSNLTLGIFKAWIKIFVTNLLIQPIVIILLSIPLAFKNINEVMFKIVLVGTIYMLYRINNFTKELFLNISQDFKYKK